MKVGFTGTQRGITHPQNERLIWQLCNEGTTEFHHGDCVGADEAAANIANLITPRPVIICHPPVLPKKRAFTDFNDVTRGAKDYLTRNRAIVDATNLLLACPGEMQELQRSGTWSTIRYAKRQRKAIIIIFPDGTLQQIIQKH